MNPNEQQGPAPSARGELPKELEGRSISHPAKPDKLIRIKEVCELSGLGKTSVYSIPDFPKRVTLSRRAVGWKLSQVQQWIESRSTVVA